MFKKFRVEVVDGVQAVNGRVTESVVDLDEHRVTISDPCDRDRLADRAFSVGRIVAREQSPGEVTYVDDAAFLPYRPQSAARRHV